MDLHEAIGRLNNGKPKKKKIQESVNFDYYGTKELKYRIVQSAEDLLDDMISVGYDGKDPDELLEWAIKTSIKNTIKHETIDALKLALELDIIDIFDIVTNDLKKEIADSEELYYNILHELPKKYRVDQ